MYPIRTSTHVEFVRDGRRPSRGPRGSVLLDHCFWCSSTLQGLSSCSVAPIRSVPRPLLLDFILILQLCARLRIKSILRRRKRSRSSNGLPNSVAPAARSCVLCHDHICRGTRIVIQSSLLTVAHCSHLEPVSWHRRSRTMMSGFILADRHTGAIGEVGFL